MGYVEKIVRKFGGVRAMGRKLGRHHGTIQGWKERNTIPDHEKINVFKVAQKEGLDLKVCDFLPFAVSDCIENGYTDGSSQGQENKTLKSEDVAPHAQGSSVNPDAIEI